MPLAMNGWYAGPGVMVGTAGWPMTRGHANWDWWYSWNLDGIDRSPRVAPLHKLRRLGDGEEADSGVHACDIAPVRIANAMANDVWGKRRRIRWLQLFNEPDNSAESAWQDDPEGAAYWATRVMRCIRRTAPWVKFVGPNILNVHDPIEEWLAPFMQSMASFTGERHRDAFDAYGVHGHYGLWHGTHVLTEHLETVREICEGFGLVPGYRVWITEIGAISGEDQATVLRYIGDLEEWLRGDGRRLGVRRVAWFVPRDTVWCGERSPNTCLYDGEGRLTRTGQRWFETWRRFSPHARR